MRDAGSIEDAIQLAVSKFKGIRDKQGQPYILHLLRVMLQVNSEEGRIAAVLHDIVEDTSVTFDELKAIGFSASIVDTVTMLTRREEESYADYIVRLSEHSPARECKLADLNDNYKLDRVAYRLHCEAEDSARIARYILSYQYLSGLLPIDAYRARMADIESRSQ